FSFALGLLGVSPEEYCIVPPHAKTRWWKMRLHNFVTGLIQFIDFCSNGCAYERAFKTHCRPSPWPLDYDEVLVCGATTGKLSPFPHRLRRVDQEKNRSEDCVIICLSRPENKSSRSGVPSNQQEGTHRSGLSFPEACQNPFASSSAAIACFRVTPGYCS